MLVNIPKVDKDWEDMVYPYLSFCYKMKFQKREWTGYKELGELGLDADWLRSLNILSDPSISGTYRFIEENIPNLVRIYAITTTSVIVPDDLWELDNIAIASKLKSYICDQTNKEST